MNSLPPIILKSAILDNLLAKKATLTARTKEISAEVKRLEKLRRPEYTEVTVRRSPLTAKDLARSKNYIGYDDPTEQDTPNHV
jgi:hypothetical protein